MTLNSEDDACLYNIPMALPDDLLRTRGLQARDAPSRHNRYVQELKEHIVGPMPVESFLDEFLPAAPKAIDKHRLSSWRAFNEVPRNAKTPAEIYEPLVCLL